MSETIRIKAVKGAPEYVGHGNFGAENKGGYFETDNRRFADHLIASGFGEETTPSAEAAATPPKTGGEPEETTPSAEAAATLPNTGGEPEKKKGGNE
ncbi:MAG: hypothetical protein IT173_12520 [Acidobacteria bacterium]|nr:hypothetical protein [Acidobacteriota bacterium]